MQKKIIALAVAGLMSGAAFAQSNVTVYGNVDVSYADSSRDIKTTTSAGVVTKQSIDGTNSGFSKGALSASTLGFKGVEDLGNGLKATFNIEYYLTDTTSSQGTDSLSDGSTGFKTRKQTVGLEGGFGSLTLGRQANSIDDVWAIGNATMKNNAFGSLFDFNNGIDYNSRNSDLISYVSPNFSGFNVGAQYGKSKSENDTTINAAPVTQTDGDYTVWGMKATYANGPIAAGFGYFNADNDAATMVGGAGTKTNTEQTSWVLSGSYNFGVAKVFGQYYDGENTNKTNNLVTGALVNQDLNAVNSAGIPIAGERDGWELGVQIPMGQVTLAGSYFQMDYDNKQTVGAAATKTSGDGDGFQLAALYSLSKRTTAYAMYGNTSFDTKSNLNGVPSSKYSNEADIWAIGMKHSF